MARARRNTVGDAVRRAARVHRDSTALVFADRIWSFCAIDRAANRVAGRFAEAGLQPGDRIAATAATPTPISSPGSGLRAAPAWCTCR